MTNITALNAERGPYAQAAIEGGIPPESLMLALEASRELDDRMVWGGRVALGNMTSVEIVLTPIPSHALAGCEGPGWVLVSLVGWSAYPFKREDGTLYWAYVAEKLLDHYETAQVCDASQLALWLGVVLKREGFSGCERQHG